MAPKFLHPEVFEHEQVHAPELRNGIATGAGCLDLHEVRRQIEGTAPQCAAPGTNGAHGDGGG